MNGQLAKLPQGGIFFFFFFLFPTRRDGCWMQSGEKASEWLMLRRDATQEPSVQATVPLRV